MPAGRFNENRERTGYDKRGGITEWEGRRPDDVERASRCLGNSGYSRVTVQRTSCQESQCWAMLGALFHQRFFRGRSV